MTGRFFGLVLMASLGYLLTGCGGESFSNLPQSGAAANNTTTTGSTGSTGNTGSTGGTGGSPGGGGTVTLTSDQTLSQHYYLGLGVNIFNDDGTLNSQAQSQCQAEIATVIPYIVSANNDGASVNATCIFPDQTLAKEATESEWLDYVISAYVVYPMPGVVPGAGPVFTLIDSRSQTLASCQAEMSLIGAGNPFTILPDDYLETANNVKVTCPSNGKGGYTLTISVDTSKYEM